MRIADRIGILTKKPDHPARESSGRALTPEHFTRQIESMNKVRSAALTTAATAYGGSPAGCAR
jgi:hypothetical protein